MFLLELLTNREEKRAIAFSTCPYMKFESKSSTEKRVVGFWHMSAKCIWLVPL